MVCGHEEKARGQNPCVGPGITIIVVMASRRRAMKELGRVTFSPDTTSSGGSPRVSLRGLRIPEREKERILLNFYKTTERREVRKNIENTHIYLIKFNKTTEEVRKIKIKHTYTMNAHAKII